MAERVGTARRPQTTLKHAAFVREYLRNGGNATDAYCTVYPKSSRETGAAESYKLLRIPEIAARVRAEWHKALTKRKIDADAVIGMIACEAEADISQLVTAEGELLPPHQWPKWMTHCVEAIDLANGKVKLTGQSQARKLLLELSGRTRNAVADSIDHMAEAILADRAKHLKQP